MKQKMMFLARARWCVPEPEALARDSAIMPARASDPKPSADERSISRRESGFGVHPGQPCMSSSLGGLWSNLPRPDFRQNVFDFQGARPPVDVFNVEGLPLAAPTASGIT